MKQIALTKGKYALVDDADFEWLNQWSWHARGKRNVYVVRKGYGKYLLMHRELVGVPPGFILDHINGNTLDNRRSNLRVCTNQQNLMNAKLAVTNTSGFKGVCWHKGRKKWKAQINVDKNTRAHIGLFDDKHHAALAYDLWAKDIYGEFARTNFLIEYHG